MSKFKCPSFAPAVTNRQIRFQIQKARARLSKISDAPMLDAEWLMLHVLGQQESSWLRAHGDDELDPTKERHYTGLVERRQTGEPLAYILGYWEFYGRRFFVNKDVLVPRPSTEGLIDAVRPKLKKGMSIADVGTGSGCIVITLALELANLRFLATDISPAALAVARKNAKTHGVLDRIEFLEGNMLEPLKDKKIDLIISNPPYLSTVTLTKAGRTADTAGLLFEPKQALDGGEDGQNLARQIKTGGIPAAVETAGGEVDFYN